MKCVMGMAPETHEMCAKTYDFRLFLYIATLVILPHCGYSYKDTHSYSVQGYDDLPGRRCLN